MSDRRRKGRKGCPNDPNRAQRICEAALAIVTEDGVRAVSYRNVAERAGVPLGSVSYYYCDIEELLEAVFGLMIQRHDPGYVQALRAAPDRNTVVDILVRFVCGDARPNTNVLRLMWQMYHYGTRSHTIAGRWATYRTECAEALIPHFGAFAGTVDALIEGWWIQAVWNGRVTDETIVRAALTRLGEAADAAEADGLAQGQRKMNA